MNLVRKIKEAFQDVPRPSDSAIADLDDGGYDGTMAAQMLRDREIYSCSPLELRQGQFALSCRYETVFYVLPAYLVAAVKDPEEADTIPGCIVSVLSFPAWSGRKAQAEFSQFIPLISTAQREVILHALEYLLELGYLDQKDLDSVSSVFALHGPIN